MDMTPEDFNERLSCFLARQVGAGQVLIDGLQRLPARSPSEMWSFDALYQQDGESVCLPLVLRRDAACAGGQTSSSEEFRLLRAVQAEGVPVPRVYWLGEDTETLGARFFIRQRVVGETDTRCLLDDAAYAPAREIMTWQLGEILARLHRIDWLRHGLAYLAQSPPDIPPATAALDRLEHLMRVTAPALCPLAERTCGWLRQHLPATTRRTIVHGDLRVGNIWFGPEGVRSILGWRRAHIGDPMEDLGMLCVRWGRFGNDEQPVGLAGQRKELFEAYERTGGLRIDPEGVRFWEVFASLSLALIDPGKTQADLDGPVACVDVASVKRRVAAIERELLDPTAP